MARHSRCSNHIHSFTSLTIILIILAPLLARAWADLYTVTDIIVGEGFYDWFDFENIPDPSHGRVDYVDRDTAIALNLTYAGGHKFILRADHTETLVQGGPGRKSVRLRSRQTVTKHVAILDIRHMPEGCGTWPAVRQKAPNSNWPRGGLIDILEGVNDAGPNSVTLHTTANCTMPANRTMTGTAKQNDCDDTVNSNTGCGVAMDDPRSYGPLFNANGGGFFAIERNDEFIKIWFWSRDSDDIPSDINLSSPVVAPYTWGTPVAYFPNTQCDLESHFQENNIIINLTLCGDWAGNVYGPPHCSGKCEDFVANPNNFFDAYFEFDAIRIYEPF